jgi:predicted enzyme related to lactoylglutathione lyase
MDLEVAGVTAAEGTTYGGAMQQPIDRVSHVVFCVREENLERAASFWRDTVGVVFEDASRPELGLRILVSLAHGIELIAPAPALGPTPARFTDFLATRGEGVYDIVYGVRDLDAAADAAEAFGVRVTHRGGFADVPPWQGRFAHLDEAHLEPFCGMTVTWGRIEPRPA